MYGLKISSTKKKNPEKITFSYLWVMSPFFSNDAVNSFLKNASIVHFKILERRPRDNKIL